VETAAAKAIDANAMTFDIDFFRTPFLIRQQFTLPAPCARRSPIGIFPFLLLQHKGN
jgi:hypothetical protein